MLEHQKGANPACNQISVNVGLELLIQRGHRCKSMGKVVKYHELGE